jgi:hypothetical protein
MKAQLRLSYYMAIKQKFLIIYDSYAVNATILIGIYYSISLQVSTLYSHLQVFLTKYTAFC